VRVLKCPLSGCTAPPQVIFQGTAFRPNDVQVSGGNVYFTQWPAVSSCPTGGCTGSPGDLGSGGGPIAIDVDSQFIYVGRVGVQTVARCPLSGCPTGWGTELVSGIRPISIAVDATSLYVSDYDHFMWGGSDAGKTARILKCPIAGCPASGPGVLESGDISPYAIAVDAERLYYTNFVQGTVVSIPK
jgi:hypothetical protein